VSRGELQGDAELVDGDGAPSASPPILSGIAFAFQVQADVVLAVADGHTAKGCDRHEHIHSRLGRESEHDAVPSIGWERLRRGQSTP